MHEPQESYEGRATVDETEVEVTLRGHFEAIDGRFHWYGRVAATESLDHRSGDTVTLTTPHGSASARLSDLDPWGRLRVAGEGPPPF